MRNFVLLAFIFFSANSSMAQDKGLLSFEIGYGKQQVSMATFNQYYLDSIAKPIGLFNENIKQLNVPFIAIRYQPSNYFDIGVFGMFCWSEIKGNPDFSATDESGKIVSVHAGKSLLQTRTLGYGISSNFHLNYLFKFYENSNNFLKRTKLLTEFNLGYGHNSVNMHFFYTGLMPSSSDAHFGMQGLFGSAFIKVEYQYLKTDFSSAIGVKFGFLWSENGVLKDPFGNEYILGNGKKIDMNVSGISAGLYLKLGK
jgi:hypothetical protein